jgi:hypothetical protein
MKRYSTDTGLFNFAFAIYLLYRAYRLSSGGTTLPLIDNYMADVLTLPVILPIIEDLLSTLKKRTIRLSKQLVFLGWIYTAFVMEYVAPKYFEHAVSDPYDGIAYGIGAVLFVLLKGPLFKVKS